MHAHHVLIHPLSISKSVVDADTLQLENSMAMYSDASANTRWKKSALQVGEWWHGIGGVTAVLHPPN